MENDHDLLVTLNTKMDSVVECLNGLPAIHEKIDARIREVERSETRCESDMTTVKNDIKELKSKSNTVDFFLSVGVIVSTIVGSIFGSNR